MPFQQQLSKQILLIKNKKLFYIITAFAENIVKYSSDILKIGQYNSIIDTTNVFDQSILISNYTCSDSTLQICNRSVNENLIINLIPKINDELGLKIEQSVEQINFFDMTKQAFDYADNIQFYKNGKVYSEGQFLELIDNTIENVDDNQKNDGFNLTDQFNHKQIFISYKNEKLYDDYQNYLYILNDDYKFKLYVDDKFILDINNYVIDGCLSKDVIFQACQRGDILLKIYDKEDNFIKNVFLKKTTVFDFNITDISFTDTSMTFKSNKYHLQGYNIYHGNSICNTDFCNFSNKNCILNGDIKYSVLSSHNVDFAHKVLFKGNSYILLRLFFNKFIYVKKIEPQFSISQINYDIIYRCSTDENSIRIVPYSNYSEQNGFYCYLLDLKINYNSALYSHLERLKVQYYDLQKEDLVKTQKTILDYNNKIVLNKKNIIDGHFQIIGDSTQQVFGYTAKTQYPNYILGYQNSQYFYLQNIELNKNNDYLQVNDPQSYAYIRFALSPNAISEDQGQTTNSFNYIYLQYQIEQKKSNLLFDFQNFSLLNVSKNFPKKLSLAYTLNDGNVIDLNFQHSVISDSVVELDSQTKKPVNYIQRWKCVTNGYTNSEFFLQKKLIVQDIGDWRNYVTLKLFQGNVCFFDTGALSINDNTDLLSFINNNNSLGFKVTYNSNEYYLNKTELLKHQISIATNQYTDNQSNWQIITGNQFGGTNTLKRNLQIRFKDGQAEHVKLYSIVLTNYNSVGVNCFFRDTQTEFDVTGNDLTNKSSESPYIENNFYNLMYCVNYFYQSERKGKIFEYSHTYFDKSKYESFNKSNLHIQWEKNELFQYLVLFDKFDNNSTNDIQRYNEYFLPFQPYHKVKTADSQYYSYMQVSEHIAQVIFDFYFEKSQIILSLQPNIIDVSQCNIKCDYYYSYSDDYINWSNYKYYYPIQAFYAKYVRVKCLMYFSDQIYCKYVEGLKLNYVDSSVYYLTNSNHFETAYQMSFQENTKYMLMIRKLYNEQSFDMTLKLFHIGSFTFLPKIQNLYVDDKRYTDHILKISGVDNICKLSFEINEDVKQLNIVLYKIQGESLELLKQIYTKKFINSQQNYNIIQYSCQLLTLKSQVYGYKVRYFNNNYQVSQFSNIVKFKFNSIPITPYNLDAGVQNI